MRLLKILAVLLAGAALVVVAVAAKAQSRYDSDQSWIKKTIRSERHKGHHHDRRNLTVEYRYRDRWRGSPVRKHYYAAPKRRHTHRHSEAHRHHRYDPLDWRAKEARRHDRRESHATRVYGIVHRGPQFVERHATSHVECFPAIQEQSGDFANDAKALNEAEIRWQAKVAVQYGMLFSDFSHATDKRSTCFRSTFDESWWGRNKEAAMQNLNISEGFKKRCVIEAKPCRAPTEILDHSRVETRMGVPPGSR